MRYGLVGEKLEHSYSKFIHESFGFYKYELFELDEDSFDSFFQKRDFLGLNITIPYKKKVLSYCDELTPIASAIGAVNTVYFRDGKLIGDNTDYFGFIHMLRQAHIDPQDKKILVLGAGGASLMVDQACRDLEAREVVVASRSGVRAVPFNQLHHHQDSQIIINATPVGMYPNNGYSIVTLKDYPKCEAVVDLIYNPLMTKLLMEAKERSLTHVNGLSMLVAQAAKACELFTQSEMSDEEMESALGQVEKRIQNIVLIGMPGCGKTTIGALLSKTLDKDFVDTDSLIEEETGMSIPAIFEQLGESEFRKIESKVAERVGKGKGQVISTGGGIVLNPQNMEYLSQNGEILFLDRPLKFLAQDGRPLSRSVEAIEKMAQERMNLYRDYSDYIISMKEDPQTNIGHILEILGGNSNEKDSIH